MNLTSELAEAIIKLRPYPNFQMFIEAIRQDQADAMLALVTAKPDAVGPLQGKAQEALAILVAVDEAAGYLEKINRVPPTTLGEDGYVRSTSQRQETGRTGRAISG